MMKPIRFAKFEIVEHRPYVYISEVRYITNQKHPQYGMCHIFTCPEFIPLTSHPLYDQLYLTESNARTVLTDNGFIEVKSDFDAHDIDHLIEIKSSIPDEWKEAFNSWKFKLNS